MAFLDSNGTTQLLAMQTSAKDTLISSSKPSQLSIQKVSLTSFRNYDALRLASDNSPVILTGANGSGKTNLLEAISLLVPGRGLRKSALVDLQNLTTQTPWGVAVELNTGYGSLHIGTGGDPQLCNEKERRLVHIDGRNIRNHSVLADHIAMAWVTPDMDGILADSSSARRKLLDRLAYSFDPSHNVRISRYEKAMRERSRLLREGMSDAAWLKALEDDMAQSGVAIAATRRHMLRQLNEAINETSSAFPRADLALRGTVEESLETLPALLVEDALRHALANSRKDDERTGTCAVGPHRTDLHVTHRTKMCPAYLCSTGEQKSLLIAIMIAYVRTLTKARNIAPLFLLDDIVAHLDDIRRDALFDEIRNLGVQAWLTGTDISPFSSFLPHAQHYIINQGQWQYPAH